jgi:hypothetical protein
MSKSKDFYNKHVETDGLKKKKIKKESRHNFKEHLKDIVDHENWDELQDELYYEEHSNHYR